jgi:N utilization substance protein B
MPVGTRREARERALGLLYEADAKEQDAQQVLDELPVPPDPFAVELVRGVQARRAEIDPLISAYSIDWALTRMPVVDRTVLRMAVWELLARRDVPIGVVISEAVELAKRYSTEESGRFVNGVLASVAAEVRPAEEASAGGATEADLPEGSQSG